MLSKDLTKECNCKSVPITTNTIENVSLGFCSQQQWADQNAKQEIVKGLCVVFIFISPLIGNYSYTESIKCFYFVFVEIFSQPKF